VQLERFPLPSPGPHEVRVRIDVSLMSTGTENIVFNQLYDPGSGWENYAKFPFYPGYAAIGTVEGAGEHAGPFRPGMRVACRSGHQSHVNMWAGGCHPVPATLSQGEAVWFAPAKIAFQAKRVAGLQPGDRVLVLGAGPIGQMAVRWAHEAGATTVIAIDRNPVRAQLALAGGATAAPCLPVAEARDAILAANGGELPRVVIDTTGNAQVFATALGLARDFGTVALLGITGRPAQQSLTGDVVRRGLHIAGVHDCHDTPEWNESTITKLFLDLSVAGRFPLGGLNTHFFAPDDCAEAYATANRERAKTMGILFRWT
jgi:2-desacetyl-2-hydroxyethyl bacteriochlorophyllide A dehydrogenase